MPDIGEEHFEHMWRFCFPLAAVSGNQMKAMAENKK